MPFPNQKYMKRTIRGSKKPQTSFKKLKKDVTFLKKVCTPEIKFLDTTITTVSAQTLVILPISLMAQGDTSNTRDGDNVIFKNLYVKGALNGASNGASENFIRLMVVRDNLQDSDGNVFQSTDLLQTDDWNSFYKADGNQTRFKILSDKVHHIGDSNTANGLGMGTLKKYVSLKIKLNYKSYFNGTAATQASAGKGKLYLCYIDVLGAGTGTAITPDIKCRLTFQDS